MWDIVGAVDVGVVRGNGRARCLSDVDGTGLRHIEIVTMLWHVRVVECSRLWVA